MQSCLRKNGEYVFYRCGQDNLHSVIEINLNSLPEHYTEYFFESILKELPESFILAEHDGKIIGYVMCKIEFGFSNFRKLGFVKKGHVVSIAILEEHRGRKVGTILMEEAINGLVSRRTEEVYLVRPGIQGPSGRCWLKRAVPQKVTNGCCVSGVLRR